MTTCIPSIPSYVTALTLGGRLSVPLLSLVALIRVVSVLLHPSQGTLRPFPIALTRPYLVCNLPLLRVCGGSGMLTSSDWTSPRRRASGP
ncbi:uncharacterized protein B0H18DRAFT_981956 [Fomitopsis serialis]|uniref:uncharacterized protein n=1 Tax=Fomitopsis serialis TaxID=139415 RepID=UPI0020086E84|nr:uncharacterized protein B0H18DRAFT_981956 [Neoantrodia serialis]KAH9933776.1 hypothetical protein B0H18DRAFT_981956 [Neoantrodia serialis]